jgi:hypothetical protein
MLHDECRDETDGLGADRHDENMKRLSNPFISMSDFLETIENHPKPYAIKAICRYGSGLHDWWRREPGHDDTMTRQQQQQQQQQQPTTTTPTPATATAVAQLQHQPCLAGSHGVLQAADGAGNGDKSGDRRSAIKADGWMMMMDG